MEFKTYWIFDVSVSKRVFDTIIKDSTSSIYVINSFKFVAYVNWANNGLEKSLSIVTQELLNPTFEFNGPVESIGVILYDIFFNTYIYLILIITTD